MNQPTEELPALHEDGPGPAPAPEPGSAAAPAVAEPAPASEPAVEPEPAVDVFEVGAEPAETAVEVFELGVEVLEAGDDLLPPFLEDVPASGSVFRRAFHPVSRFSLGAVVQRALDVVVSEAVPGIAARCLIGHDLQHTHA